MPPRRQFLSSTSLFAAAGASGLSTATSVGAQEATSKSTAGAPFRYCFNTSTIRGQNLPIEQEIEIAAKAGFDAIEPWIGKIKEYVDKGGSLEDLRKKIADLGLTVESAIGFAKWIVDDDAERAEAMKEARRDMEWVAAIGGTRIAAPPAGATKDPGLDLEKAGERYRQLLELGDETGVVPQIEVWGFSANLSQLSESMHVAIAAGHPRACLLADVYHLHKGGSDIQGLRLLGPKALQVFHFNDYPADPPRSEIKDEHRVFCGKGVAPIAEIIRIFRAVGANPVLSLELFNRDYWKLDALDCAKQGLETMKAAVESVPVEV